MRLVLVFIFLLTGTMTLCQLNTKESVRKSPVSCYMSFDSRDFFNEDFIEQSGRKSVEERKIDFPEGKFGKGIRMSYIPPPLDETNMSGIDLDLITAVIFNTYPGNKMGYNEPFFFGSGRINPRLGAVAFWTKGKLPYNGPLFEQTTISFGRKERDLIGVVVEKDNKLSAYVRDARYVRHEIKSEVKWDESGWNHIVLNWDWANGMELWLNGNKVASSWGTDGWFETAPPGLFHLPTPGIIYDELYLMDRPLSEPEIKKLISLNIVSKDESPVYSRVKDDQMRIAHYCGVDRSENLPEISPDKAFFISEIWPSSVSDGNIPGWHIIDGRNEMAWPHPYAFFTIIPGDGDFHAEKVEIGTPPESKVNYVVLTGNLTNVKVQSCSGKWKDTEDIFAVPSGNGFFYGSTITTRDEPTFIIPLTENYGTPPDFKGDIRLPLSGEKRIQDIGLYHFITVPSEGYNPQGNRLILNLNNYESGLDERTRFALHAITSRDERTIAIASPVISKDDSKAIDIGSFSRLNILSEPYYNDIGITGVTISLPVKTSDPEEILYVRVHDPAVPLRLWNQFAVKLKGFDRGYKRLFLTIDFQDLVLTGGDRLWVDIGTVGETEIIIGDKNNKAEIFIPAVSGYRVIDAYAEKELISAKAQYSKQYEFMPWQFTGRKVSVEEPYCYGGPFDMIMPALAVRRIRSDDFVANFHIQMSGPDFKDGKRIEPEKASLVTLTDPYGAPDWAIYMRDYNRKRWAMGNWWVKHQNIDGQVGGGWNDDTLFGCMGLEDLMFDGHNEVGNMIDAIFAKFELTRIFKDGYCNIYPIDRLHTGDFISERYKSVVHNLGMAYTVEREMEAAWHLGKPELTPVNYYADGFKSSANVMNWYWGKDVPATPYVSKSIDELTKEFRLFTSVFDDNNFYRMTESHVMTDDFVPYGSGPYQDNNMYAYMLGGARGSRIDAHVKLAVMWPSGGGPDVARIVLRADDASLDAVVYSFDSKMRNLEMRLCRIHDGNYRIGLYADNLSTGEAGDPIWSTETYLSRFDIVKLPLPPRKPLFLKVQQLKEFSRPGELPDMAIDTWDAVWEHDSVFTTIHNLGNEKAEKITVRLVNGEETLQEKVITRLDAPTDFIAKRIIVKFANVAFSRNLKVILDPENTIREIYEGNNCADVDFPGLIHTDQILWDIYRGRLDQAWSGLHMQNKNLIPCKSDK